MNDWPSRYIEKDEAAAAARAAASTIEEPFEGADRQVVHTFAGGRGIVLGADHDLEDLLELIARADEVAWVTNPFEHDLAIRVDGRILQLNVPRPERSGVRLEAVE